MITIRIPSHLFTALRSSVEAASPDDARIESEMLDRVQAALTEASATARGGFPVVMTLDSPDELNLLAVCFEVGSELDPGVTTEQWNAIQVLFEEALRTR